MRSRLLGWRLVSHFEVWPDPSLPGLEGRVQQVVGPLVAVTTATASREALLRVASTAQFDLTEERRTSRQGGILAILVQLAQATGVTPAKIYLQAVVAQTEVVGASVAVQGIAARDVASVCRQLQMDPVKDRQGRFVLFDPADHRAALEQYGLVEPEASTA